MENARRYTSLVSDVVADLLPEYKTREVNLAAKQRYICYRGIFGRDNKTLKSILLMTLGGTSIANFPVLVFSLLIFSPKCAY